MNDKVAKTMREFKDKKLRSGSGQKVTDRTQALRIAMEQKRKAKKGSSPFQAAKKSY